MTSACRKSVFLFKNRGQKVRHITRRDFIKICSAAGALIIAPRSGIAVSAQEAAGLNYPLTIATLKAAYENEMDARSSYTAFSQQAIKDRYPNIAYLFKTFATSESIHAGLFKKALADLDIALEAGGDRQVEVLSTKKNLRKAARHELELIKNFYPQAIKRIKTEKHENALRYCHYSWQSHKQHRNYIEDIDRWSGIFFSMVAETIEKKDLQFVVCRFCGSTESEIPPETCAVCGQTSTHYEKITRPTDL